MTCLETARYAVDDQDGVSFRSLEIGLENLQCRRGTLTEIRLPERLQAAIGPDLNDTDLATPIAFGRRSLFVVVFHGGHLGDRFVPQPRGKTPGSARTYSVDGGDSLGFVGRTDGTVSLASAGFM